MAYVCKVCGYVYEGDDFKDLPDDWVCPLLWCRKRPIWRTIIIYSSFYLF